MAISAGTENPLNVKNRRLRTDGSYEPFTEGVISSEEIRGYVRDV